MLLRPNHFFEFKCGGRRGLCLVSNMFAGRLPRFVKAERFRSVMGVS